MRETVIIVSPREKSRYTLSFDDLGKLVILAVDDAFNEVGAKCFELFPARIGVHYDVDELGFQAAQRFGHRGGPFSSSGSKSIRVGMQTGVQSSACGQPSLVGRSVRPK